MSSSHAFLERSYGQNKANSLLGYVTSNQLQLSEFKKKEAILIFEGLWARWVVESRGKEGGYKGRGTNLTKMYYKLRVLGRGIYSNSDLSIRRNKIVSR